MDSVNRHGILLEVIQFLVDLNLVITKAYISSDGGYLMDGKSANLYKFVHLKVFNFLT